MLIDVRSQSFSDAITDDEQRLIDEAVQAGKVRKVPMGASGLPEFRWFERKGHGGVLRAVDPETGEPVDASWKAQKANATKPWLVRTRRLEPRRQEIRALVDQGLTVPEIAAKMDLPRHTVWRDVHVMGLDPVKAPPVPRVHAYTKLGEVNRGRIRDAWHPEITARELCEAVGMSRSSVNKHIKALGLKCRDPRK